MLVKELFTSIDNYEKLYNEYLKYFNMPENESMLAVIKEQAIKNLNLFIKKMRETNTKNVKNESVIFVVKLEKINEETHDIESYIDSFLCYKKDINEKTENGEISLWGDCANKIKHYAYDTISFLDILAQDAYIDENIEKEEALANIIFNMSRMGFTEAEKKGAVDKIEKALIEAEKSINEGKTYSADEVFDNLQKKLLSKLSNKEKNKFLEERKKRQENDKILKKYRYIIMYSNNCKCVILIYKYYLENLKNENFLI